MLEKKKKIKTKQVCDTVNPAFAPVKPNIPFHPRTLFDASVKKHKHARPFVGEFTVKRKKADGKSRGTVVKNSIVNID